MEEKRLHINLLFRSSVTVMRWYGLVTNSVLRRIDGSQGKEGPGFSKDTQHGPLGQTVYHQRKEICQGSWVPSWCTCRHDLTHFQSLNTGGGVQYWKYMNRRYKHAQLGFTGVNSTVFHPQHSISTWLFAQPISVLPSIHSIIGLQKLSGRGWAAL